MAQPTPIRFFAAHRAIGRCAVLVTLACMTRSAYAQAPLASTVFPVDSARSRRTTPTSSQRSIVDTLTATLSKLEMHETTVPAGGAAHEPHRHPDEEIIVMRSGVIEALLGTTKRRVGPGGVVVMASNELHGLRNPGRVPATYLVIRVYPHDLPAAAKPPTAPPAPR